MILTDKLTIDAPRRTKEGYLAVRAHAARTGIQDYLGIEVDPEGKHFKAHDRVSVYRPENEVFDEASVHSFLMKPITNDHPKEAVTRDNWSKLAKGVVAKAMRDGDHLNFDLIFMDGPTIDDIESGKRELSNGYAVDLKIGDGITPDGRPYQAMQTAIRGNHVALVDKGRAGPDCAIGVCDAMDTDNISKFLFSAGDNKPMKTIVVDGHNVEVSDAAEIAISNLNRKLADQAKIIADQAAIDAKVAIDMAAKDAKIATLDAEVATLKAAQLTGDAMDAAVAARAKLVDDAKKIGGEKMDLTGSNGEIKKRAVLAKLGDTYSTRDAAFFDAAFELQVAAIGDTQPDTMRDGIRNIPVADAKSREPVRTAYMEMVKGLNDASQPNAAKAN